MHRTTPLPLGPSGKSITLILPSSRWNNPIWSFDNFRQCVIKAICRVGFPIATTTSDGSANSFIKVCHTFPVWSHRWPRTVSPSPSRMSGSTPVSCKLEGKEMVVRKTRHQLQPISYRIHFTRYGYLFCLGKQYVRIQFCHLFNIHISWYTIST